MNERQVPQLPVESQPPKMEANAAIESLNPPAAAVAQEIVDEVIDLREAANAA